MTHVPRFLSGSLAAILVAACGATRPGTVPLPTTGLVSQETILHACRQRTVRRSGTSGFEALPGGEESYLARLAMIDAAQRSLDVQYFIWKDDVTGTVIADRLLAAADRGVRVRLLLDLTTDAQKEVSSAALAAHPNIQVGFFNPMSELKGIFAGNPIPVIGDIDRMQCRMHNKLLLADNAILIGGGRNLGDAYFGIDKRHNMRDLDFIAAGPVVDDAAKSFEAFWRSPLTYIDDQTKVTNRERGKLQDLRNHIARKKRSLARQNGSPFPIVMGREEALRVLRQLSDRMIWARYDFVADPPERMLRSVRATSPVGHTVEGALGKARSEVLMHAAYFIPQNDMLDLLRGLTGRGVDVRVLTNSLASVDALPAMAGLANRRGQALDTGILLFEMNAHAPSRREYIRSKHLTPMGMHTKGFVVDGRESFIGSYNMDPRSKYINTESGVIIHGEAFASRLKTYLAKDLEPANCWHISRDVDGNIIWTGHHSGGPKTTHLSDPNTSFIRRLKFWGLRLLPWEDYL